MKNKSIDDNKEWIGNETLCQITDAMNTYDWALTIIKSKGFKIFLYPDDREEYYGNYYAIQKQRLFVASDPLRLLGIISLWETLGDNWQNPDNMKYENLYDKIGSIAFPDNSSDFDKFTDEDFDNIVNDYRIFFDRLNLSRKIPNKVSRKKFFDIVDNFYKQDLE